MKATTMIRVALPIALLLAATTARAQSEPAPISSYRWQAATADAVAVTAAVAGFSLEGTDGSLDYVPSNMLMGIGIGGYYLGAPIVHAAHRHFGRAGVSLALRVGLPVLGGAIGSQFANCGPNEFLCGLDEFGKGFAAGAAAAVFVDNVLLFLLPSADETPDHAVTTVRSPARPASSLQIEPRLAAAPNAAMLGVGGRF
jgi:hypothetical protein